MKHMETITNEIMTNEAVAEATEEIVTTVSSNKSFMKKVATIGGTAVIIGGGLYLIDKFVVKPIKAKKKAKKELEEVDTDVEAACDVENDEEAVDNVTDINEAR
jgi:hypothetical protein